MKTILFFFLILFFAFPVSAYVPSDPLYSSQTYLSQIGADQAWDLASGKGVIVAVLDSGVDIDHPDLRMNIWKNEYEIPGDYIDNDHNGYVDDINGWDFFANLPSPKPKLTKWYDSSSVSHGTAISGIIAGAANNEKGIIGLSFGSKIMPVRIMDDHGDGDVVDLIKGIKYAVNNKADIINLSLVGYDYSKELGRIVQWAEDQGVLIVSASGNTDSNTKGIDLDVSPSYPACYEKVLAVSSVDGNDQKSHFSNYGSICVDLTAPGEDLLSLGYYDSLNPDFSDLYVYDWSGTSFSTALTSAVSALVKSKSRNLTPRQIREVLIASADDISAENPDYEGQLGNGRINAAEAVKQADPFFSGRLVKLENSSAVYYEENGFKRLFPSEKVFWSWHAGTWEDYEMKIISQAEFDDLVQKKNIIARSGNLIKFANSSKIYEVRMNDICEMDGSSAQESYGNSWQEKILEIQPGFFTDYNLISNCG